MVEVPGVDGALGILPGHTFLLSRMDQGVLSYQDEDGSTHRMVVIGGYLEVSSDRVTILADEVELPEELDRAQIEEELKEAQDQLAGASTLEEVETTRELVGRLEARKQTFQGSGR